MSKNLRVEEIGGVADAEPRGPGPWKMDGPRNRKTDPPARPAKTHGSVVSKTGQKAGQTEADKKTVLRKRGSGKGNWGTPGGEVVDIIDDLAQEFEEPILISPHALDNIKE